MKRFIMAAVLCCPVFYSCSGGTDGITVISREDGSGTRGAFIELFGIQSKDASGKTIDNTVDTADITNSTSVVMTSVAQNRRAIGYISLGSMNSSIKALAIDGVSADAENVKNGTYKISRPFNIVLRDDLNPVAADFIAFVLSPAGQAVVSKAGYIPVSEGIPASSGRPSGKAVIAGSSSVTPVMEKLKEAYAAVNGEASVEIQQSDSTMGIGNTIDGICDIGMASRELKDAEKARGIRATVIALDGIAVIVNKENPLSGISSKNVRAIYTGEITSWSGVSE